MEKLAKNPTNEKICASHRVEGDGNEKFYWDKVANEFSGRN